MSRKLLHICLVLLLFVATTGINTSKHLCNGKIVAVSLGSDHLFCCSDEEENCCKISNDWIHLSTQYISPYSNSTFENFTEFSVDNYLNSFSLCRNYEISDQSVVLTEYPPPVQLNRLLAHLQSYLL